MLAPRLPAPRSPPRFLYPPDSPLWMLWLKLGLFGEQGDECSNAGGLAVRVLILDGFLF